MAFDPDYDLAAAAAVTAAVAAATGVFHVKNFTVAVPHRSQTINSTIVLNQISHQQK